jgi:hypothetical protein
MAKVRFKAGTTARKARGKVAEALKRRGMPASRAFPIATGIVKKASTAGRKRLARRGLRKKR